MDLIRTDIGVAAALADGRTLPLTHIIGVGRNYAEHADEQGAERPQRPMLFAKNPASASLHDEPIVIPTICQDREQVDFEGELAVIIGRPMRDVSEREAIDGALGFTSANDVSARWWQKQGAGGQFYRGKSFDSFCPIGPRIVQASEIGDPCAGAGLTLTTRVNGEVMQRASTAQMIFPIASLIAQISQGMTLTAGTVLLTGTPSGVGFARQPPRFLRAGDIVEIEIDRIGVLRNAVHAEC